MSLRVRIVGVFIGLLILTIILIFIIYVGTITYVYYANDMLVKAEIFPRDLITHLVEETTMTPDGQIQIAPEALEEIKKWKGWAQILDEQGKEVYQFHKPDSFPKQYTTSELALYKRDEIATGYSIYTWWDQKNDQSYTWVMAIPHLEAMLLKEVVANTAFQDGNIQIPIHLLKKIEQQKTWIQVLDGEGKEVFSHQRPEWLPRHYTPGEFIAIKEYDTRLIYTAAQRNEQEYTWLMGVRGSREGHDPELVRFDRQKMMKLQSMATWMTLGGWGIILILTALLIGRMLGSPMLHVMKWIQDLSQGNYCEPVDRKGRARSRTVSGKLRRSYRIYREVIEAIRKLTITLKQNEEKRKKLDKTREEWIAGVSHDLKTPLSSVKGYAQLIMEEKYQWNQDEIRRYATVILEKAAYMDQLIEDLNLTFRLKNQALPLNRIPTDVVELVRREVIELLNNPHYSTYNIGFYPEISKYVIALDRKWFRRALSNLFMNAVIHNPPGTQVDVIVKADEAPDEKRKGVWIMIQDNGVGMDEETKSRLFERYYRGSNTAQRAEGSGLGMAIAHQLILAHQGQVTIESEPGKGTTLNIYLEPSS